MKFKFFAFFMGMLLMSSILVAKPSVDIDKEFYYASSDLGLSFKESSSVFKCWAPLAKSVKVLLFKDAENLSKPAKSLKMKKDSENPGVWILEANTEGFSYYQYEIANPGKKSRVCDIWGKAASVDSQASQIVDINKDKSAIPENLKFDTEWGTKDGYYNPFGENGKTSKSYTDAVIYEMHIRDWSRVEVSDSFGKFTQIGDGEKIISHLKDLGVTHVQILPSFEYAEKASNKMYNWGYNPFNYNVPETRYVQDGFKDGSQAVKEMRY
ncbi:MAG: hypothetical protein SOX89_07470, partial [Treponema sp.]|nr:hypothetical protein [Treponema sp.]